MRKWRIHLASASGFAPKTDSAAISIMIMVATESLVGATIPRQRSIPLANCGFAAEDISEFTTHAARRLGHLQRSIAGFQVP
jgi:hypothetical protein